MLVNIWLALRDDAQTLIVERLKWDEEADGAYSGPVDNQTHNLFSYMQNQGQRQGLFRAHTAQGRSWKLWSFTLEGSARLKQEIDDLIVKYPNHILVLGAWRFDNGAPVGTDLTWDTRTVTKTWSIRNPDYQPDPELTDYDPRLIVRITGPVEEEYITGFSGTPIYPQHPQLIKLMPDVEGVPASVITDINLLMGQAPRVFE